MGKFIRKIMMTLALGIGAIAVAPEAAEASDYCREYTRSVTIGNRIQEAYGRACLQPDGAWMIVNEGLDDDSYLPPSNVNDVRYVIHDDRRDVVPTRVVYYDQPQVNYYRTRPAAPVFIWSHNGHYRGSHYTPYKKVKYVHRDVHHYHGKKHKGDWREGRYYDRDHRDDHRGRGRGRGRDDD